MTIRDTLAPLLEAIEAASRWLESCGVDAAVVGGVAASLHGNARATGDIDFVVAVDPDEWQTLLARGASFGIVPRAIGRPGVLAARHQPTLIEVDLRPATQPFERDLIERAVTKRVGGVAIRVGTAADLEQLARMFPRTNG
jgi:hypothetical protein